MYVFEEKYLRYLENVYVKKLIYQTKSLYAGPLSAGKNNYFCGFILML